MRVDYTDVSEAPGSQITCEALSMMWTRYAFAADLSLGRDVLEVACGAGQGLGCLARRARRVVGADYTLGLLSRVRQHYDGRIPLVQLDAHWLPFRDRTFDLVVLYEAIYYLADPGEFLAECHRVLRDHGMVLICSVNPEWSDFNPSPFSYRYFSSRELAGLLQGQGFTPELYGAFPVMRGSVREQLVSMIKRIAVFFHLIPKTMRGKEFLKRIFFGKLLPIPSEVKEGMAEYASPVPISSDLPSIQYKVIYVVARAR